jgi:hypothetical protein
VRRARSLRFRPTRILALVLALTGNVSITLLGTGEAAEGRLPRADLLGRALAAYQRLESTHALRTKLLTVIDYSLPSSDRRLWVLDPTGPLRVLFHEFVAHGRGSASSDDPDRAIQFGNEEASLRSSLGAFLTGATYTGKHGHSLELIGLDPGINDHAFARRIVMHPADYVSAAFRARHGRVGRSFGCPSLDPAVSTAVIDRIRDGSVLYIGAAEPPDPTERTAHADPR